MALEFGWRMQGKRHGICDSRQVTSAEREGHQWGRGGFKGTAFGPG